VRRAGGLRELAQQVIDRHAIGLLLTADEPHTCVAPLLSPDQESARTEVLDQLEANPSVLRAFVNRFERDGTCVVTLAIRGVGTGELKIPTGRFSQTSLDDYSALLGPIEGTA
jgi:hypothetical protein